MIVENRRPASGLPAIRGPGRVRPASGLRPASRARFSWLIAPVLVLATAPGTEGIAQESGPSKPETKLHRVQAGKRGEDGWYQAESTEGHFRVKMPIPFNDYTVRAENKEGRKVAAFMIGGATAKEYSFLVMESSEIPPDKTPDDLLKEFVDGFREKGDTISEEKFFEHAGHPAVRFEITHRGSAASVRYIIADGHFFMQLVEFPPTSRKDVGPLLAPFFDSLEIPEAKQPESKRPSTAKG